MPYNNIRIKLPLMFTILCALIKSYVRVVDFVNRIITRVAKMLAAIANEKKLDKIFDAKIIEVIKGFHYIVLADGLCPDLDS